MTTDPKESTMEQRVKTFCVNDEGDPYENITLDDMIAFAQSELDRRDKEIREFVEKYQQTVDIGHPDDVCIVSCVYCNDLIKFLDARDSKESLTTERKK